MIADRTGAAELAFCFGFPYADFAECGPAVAAYADTQAAADEAADTSEDDVIDAEIVDEGESK